MALNRRDIGALALAGMVAVAMPLLAVRSGAGLVVTTPAPVAMLAPSTPPPLRAIGGRAVFASNDPALASDAPLPADAPQLVGIVGRIGTDAVALVRVGVRAGEGASRTLAVGESIDGWRLESLAIDAGFFTRGTQRLRVPLPAG